MNQDNIVPVRRLMYPPGAGGSWLMNCLSHLRFGASNHPYMTGHYHSTEHFPVAFDDHWVMRKLHRKDSFYFSGSCSFNFYLNYMVKLGFAQDLKRQRRNENKLHGVNHTVQILLNWYDNDSKLKQHPGYITYTKLWHDPIGFEEEFSKFWNVVFPDGSSCAYDKEKLFMTVHRFKSTAINPNKYFGNTEEPLWLAWCWIIINKYNLMNRDEDSIIMYTNRNIEKKILPDHAYTSTHPEILKKLVTKYNEECVSITERMTYFYPES